MKKEYKAPVMLVVNVKTESLLDVISKGENMSTGEAAGRQSNNNWEDE